MSEKDQNLYNIVLSYFEDDGLTEDDVRAYLLDTMKRAEEEYNSKRGKKLREKRIAALDVLLEWYNYFLSLYGLEDPDIANWDLNLMLDTLDELLLGEQSKSKSVKKDNSDAIQNFLDKYVR